MPIGIVAHVEEGKKDLAMDFYRLTWLGVSPIDSYDGIVFV